MDKGRGYVRNWRSIDEWQWYTAPHHAHVFQHMIRKASHKDRFWQGIEIKRGQLLTSQELLAAQCGVSRKAIRTIVTHLSLSGEIRCERASHRADAGSIITICNYEIYQSIEGDLGQPEGQQWANEGPTRGQRGASDNNGKELDSPEKKKKRCAVTAQKPPEVEEGLWGEFLVLRRAKRAPLTPRAIEAIKREAEKAGITITEALTICIERGWQSFKADWVMPQKAARPYGNPPGKAAENPWGDPTEEEIDALDDRLGLKHNTMDGKP